MRPVQTVAAITLTTALMLTACGAAADERPPISSAGPSGAAAPPPTSAPATSGDLCSLVTSAEIGSVLGKPVTQQEKPTANRCLYYTADPLVYVDLEIDRERAMASWRGINGGNDMIGASQDAVAGVGDRAFFGPRDRLYVLRGNVFLAIEAGFDDQVRERAKQVAVLALRKV